jgi:hypothetical protein
MPVDQIPGALEKFVTASWRWWFGLVLFGLACVIASAEWIKSLTTLQLWVFGIIAFGASMTVPYALGFGYQLWREHQDKQDKIAAEHRAAERSKEAAKEADLARRANLFLEIDQCNDAEKNLIHRAFLNGGSTIVRAQHGFSTEESRATRALVKKNLFNMGDSGPEGEMILLRPEFMSVLHARYGEDSEDKAQLRKDVEVWTEKMNQQVLQHLKAQADQREEKEIERLKEAARAEHFAQQDRDATIRKDLLRASVDEAMMLMDAFEDGGTWVNTTSHSDGNTQYTLANCVTKGYLLRAADGPFGMIYKIDAQVMDHIERELERRGVTPEAFFKSICERQTTEGRKKPRSGTPET